MTYFSFLETGCDQSEGSRSALLYAPKRYLGTGDLRAEGALEGACKPSLMLFALQLSLDNSSVVLQFPDPMAAPLVVPALRKHTATVIWAHGLGDR